MENGNQKQVPEDPNEHCPGTEAEDAGKSDASASCPNQEACATAPKGPDPGVLTSNDEVDLIVGRIYARGPGALEHCRPAYYRVPDEIREEMGIDWFEPRKVSIGPQYHELSHLAQYRLVKQEYMVLLADRHNDQGIIALCKDKVLHSIMEIRACYLYAASAFPPYSDDQLVDIIVQDSLFILEFLLQFMDGRPHSSLEDIDFDSDIILHDLVLHENQIPLFILREMFECAVSTIRTDTTSFVQFLLPVLNFNNLFDCDLDVDNVSICNVPHILGLLRECYNSSQPLDDLSTVVKPATHLCKSGMTFIPNTSSRHMKMYVKLPSSSWSTEKPYLAMPVLLVKPHTESTMMNLLAYDQCFAYKYMFIGSYVHAMGCLVQKKDDVAELINSGVIVDNLKSGVIADNLNSGEIADNLDSKQKIVLLMHHVFRHRGDGLSLYSEQFDKIDRYCRTNTHDRWILMIVVLANVLLGVFNLCWKQR